MNGIEIFESAEFGSVRTVTVNNEPYFVGKDVATILGYSNPSKAINDHTDSEDITTNDSLVVNGMKMLLINESGLYSLVMSSKLPTAKKFKRWVTSEVLPTIRQHGAYMTPDVIEQTLTNPDFIIGLATKLKEEQEKTKALTQKIASDAPKVLFADSVAASDTSILVGELAKIIKQNGVNIGQNRLFECLRGKGYLISRKGTDRNMPTQKAMDLGLFEIKERAINNPDGSVRVTKTVKVTGKGQQYFVNKFLSDKSVPTWDIADV